MNQKPDFESLENWADRKLKHLGNPAPPADFLAGVMQHIKKQPVTYVTPDQTSVYVVWLRCGVVMASCLLLGMGLFADVSWIQRWWEQSWIGDASLMAWHLGNGCQQLVGTMLGLVPQYVWIGLGVSITLAYLMLAITGALVLQFTMNRSRVSAL